jgi:ceramide glucosyltransferase
MDNLRAFAKQRYPQFELVFGVADPLDPAIPVVRELRAEFPELRMSLVTGGPQRGLNPKVNNLASLSRFARHDVWLISDADVRPRPGSLRALVSELEEPGGGMVHSLLWSRPLGRLGAVLESITACAFVLPIIGAASLLGHPCVIGKSMLFRARDLGTIGDWASVADVLAEDYVLGRHFARRFRVKLSTHPLETCQPARTLAGFLRRHWRWLQMRRRMSLRAYLAELLALPGAWCLLLLAYALVLPKPEHGSWAVALGAGGLALHCLADAALTALLAGSFRVMTQLHLIVLKDLLMLIAWCGAFVGCRVHWAGHDLIIGEGSTLSRRARKHPALPALTARPRSGT